MPEKLNGLERNWEVSQLQKKVSKIELGGRMQGTEMKNARGIPMPTQPARKDMCRKSRTIRTRVLPDQH